MGKVAFLGLVAATIVFLDELGKLSVWHLDILAYAALLFFAMLLFALDLERFFQNPYPLRTKVMDTLLSTFLGDYYEENRCWFNWQLNLYGNQCLAKETLFDSYKYPALCVFNDLEEDLMPSIGDRRNFQPFPRVEFDQQRHDAQLLPIITGLEDQWPDSEINLHKVTPLDKNKVCIKFYIVGSCQIKLKVQIEDLNLYKCMIEVYRAGESKKFAEHVGYFTDRAKVQLLFAFFEDFERNPVSGVIDVRRGGVQRGRSGAKIIHCFRIQDAMQFINDNNHALLVTQRHVDHSFWVL